MKYYCPVCDKPAWFYNDAEPKSYCEYCDKDYLSADFYPDVEEADDIREGQAADDRIHDWLIENRND